MRGISTILLVTLCISPLAGTSFAWSWLWDSKVKLRDVKVLSLYSGSMTSGRRSSPIPQLKCVGGNANCPFQPKVVTCYNRGSDGYDAQWECKTEMHYKYKFGWISVNCEGYDYPNDPYVLKGSCGLEYTIDFSGYGDSYYSSEYHLAQRKSGLKILAVVVAFAIIIYIVSITSCRPRRKRSQRNNDSPPPTTAKSGVQSTSSSSRRGVSFNWGSSKSSSSYRSSGAGMFSRMASGFGGTTRR